MINYANDFEEISTALSNNDELKRQVLTLVQSEPIAGKVTEGGNRLDEFRKILIDFFTEETDLPQAITQTEQRLNRYTSIHSGNNRVFPARWPEKLVRTQVSRFYNQAVLIIIIAHGSDSCFVSHSNNEDPASRCSRELANTTQNARQMLQRLKSSYGDGNWTGDLTLPEHPYCTHTFRPVN